MTAEPTPGEIMRRLDANTSQLDRIAAQLQQDRDRADKRYVDREAWNLARLADQAAVKEVADDVQGIKDAEADKVKEQTQYRRQQALYILGAFATSMGGLIVWLITLALSGGKP